jgi:hypothetical protein
MMTFAPLRAADTAAATPDGVAAMTTMSALSTAEEIPSALSSVNAERK